MDFWSSFPGKKKFTSRRSKIHGIWAFFRSIPKAVFALLHLLLALGGVYFLLLQHSLEEQLVVEPTPRDIIEHKHHVLLVELLDTYMRYEHYHKELYGRFTYDLRNLAVFHGFSSSDLLYLEAVYELYAGELDSGVFSVSVISKNSYEKEKHKFVEKINLDEKFQLTANFPLPSPSKSYLKREAYRMMRQRSRGKKFVSGIGHPYMSFHNRTDNEGKGYWYAEGLRAPIKGDRYAINGSPYTPTTNSSSKEETLNSFSLALQKDKLKQSKVTFSREDFYAFLEEAKFAQYVYERETGRKASSWAELDLFFRFQFEYRAKRVDNFSLEVINTDKEGALLAVRGTKGALLGEYFSLGENGKLEKLQYTNIFIDEVQRSTDLLRGKSGGFQVKELGREPALDSSDF